MMAVARDICHSRVELLGCLFDLVSMEQTVNKCVAWCRGPRRSHTVATVNAGILSTMAHDPELRHACANADLIVPDGVPVVWSSHLIGTRLVERVAGIDLMTELLETSARNGLRVYFLGGKPEVLEKLAQVCEAKYPGLIICGKRDGYFPAVEEHRVIHGIRSSRPDILFVGMPTPFKETWCERHKDALCVPVILGVGGSFDVLAGYLRRAPRFMQRMGMEWSWRLILEPRKMWRRYLVSNPKFIWSVAREVVRRRVFQMRGKFRPSTMRGNGR